MYLQQTNPLLVASGFAAYSFASSIVMFPMLNRYYLKALDVSADNTVTASPNFQAIKILKHYTL